MVGQFSCALTTTRPVQEMTDTAAAIRAAKEVQAQELAPELYRQSKEWFLKARKHYRLKNFYEAKNFAEKARQLAEKAEFQSLVAGGNRAQEPPDPYSQFESSSETSSEETPSEGSAEATMEPPAENSDTNALPQPNNGIYFESYEEQLQNQKKPPEAKPEPLPE